MVILQISTVFDSVAVPSQPYWMRPCIPKPGYDYGVSCRFEYVPECSFLPCTSFRYPGGDLD